MSSQYSLGRRFLSFTGGLIGFVLVSAVAGALVAATALPAIGLVTIGTQKVDDFYQSIPDDLKIPVLPEKSDVYAMDDNGNPVLLASFFDQYRENVAWEEIPDSVEDGLLAAEDARYYDHGGIDPQGVVRAAVSNYLGKDMQGASTITQQYVKNLRVQEAESIKDDTERAAAYKEATETSLSRKLTEMKTAIDLEKKMTKEEILLGYLNTVGFGARVYGIEAAANYYYNVKAKDLSLNQAATLVGMVNSPNLYRIDKPENEENGQANGYALTVERRNYVLSSMLANAKITREEYDAAVAEPITPSITQPSTGCQTAGGAAYFCDYVTHVIETNPVFGDTPEARKDLLRKGGLQIYTTLDLTLQKASEDAVNNWVPHVYDGADLGATSVSVQPGTGEILAMTQNKDYTEDAELAATSPGFTSVNYNADYELGSSTGFQPGSTYKLFTLIQWLKSGHSMYEGLYGKTNYTHFTNSCEGDWDGKLRISNDGGESGGYTNAFRSTVGSINTGYMSMAEKLDLCAIRDTASSMGVHRADGDQLQSNPTSPIGTNEVAPLQMASAYATVAAGGVRCDPIAISKVVNSAGDELPIPQSNCVQAVDRSVINQAIPALEQVITNGTATNSRVRDGVPMIGKTGTTDDAIHTWMIGSTTNVATAVWVGNVTGDANMRGITVNGTQAAQIRHKIFPEVMRVADERYGGNNF